MADVKVASGSPLCKAPERMDSSSVFPRAAPAFTLPPRNTRTAPGSTARIDGKVRGSPEPQVTWYRNGQPVQDGGRYTVEQSARGTFCLTIKEVTAEDGGKYTCEVANEEGVRQVTIELIVEGGSAMSYRLPSSSRSPGSPFGVPPIENRPSVWGESLPKFITKPNRSVVTEGQTGRFSCKITGRPLPAVTWHKDDVQLLSGERYHMHDKSGVHFLEIRAVRTSDAGIYTCTVANSCGQSSASADLVVQGCDKTDRFSSPLGGSVTPVTNSPISSNGILKKHREISSEKRESVEVSSGKPGAQVASKSSLLSKGASSSVSSTVQLSLSKSGSPSSGVRGTSSESDNSGLSPKLPEGSTKSSYGKTSTIQTTKETPSIVSRYSSILESKVTSPVPSSKATTKSLAEAAEPVHQNSSSLESKSKILNTKPTNIQTPTLDSTAVSSYSRMKSPPAMPEVKRSGPQGTSALASKYTSTAQNFGGFYTPKVTATTKETTVCDLVSSSKVEQVPLKGKVRPALAGPKDTSATDSKIVENKPSNKTLSTSPKNMTSTSTRETNVFIHDNNVKVSAMEPPSTIETRLKGTEPITPKLDHRKESANVCQSTTNILLKKTSFSSPNSQPDGPLRTMDRSESHRVGPSAEALSSNAAGDGKNPQKSSSTITLKSIKVPPTPENSCGLRDQKNEKLQVSKLQKVSLVSAEDQRGAVETSSTTGGTGPKFELTPSSQEVLEDSEVTFHCKGVRLGSPR